MSQTDYLENIRTHLLSGASVMRQVAEQNAEQILAAGNAIAEALRAGNKLLLCGNGGSAADCQHMAAELVSRMSRDFERPGLPAIALTTDTSFLTAFANDCGYEGVFARQVQALGKAGDVLLGISTSGKSPNVVRAVEAARELNLTTVALTGKSGCLTALADFVVSIPSDDTQRIQEAHLAVEHSICFIIEHRLFSRPAD